MPEDQGPDLRLDSWKSIAAYLKRDVRTVIRWEENRGLPVRRMPGSARSAVYAFQHEIDGWLRGQTGLKGADSVERANAGGDGQAVEAAGGRGGRWVGVGMALVLVLAAAAVAMKMHGERRQPARVVFTTDTLQAWDDEGHVLWAHRFAEPFANTASVGDLDPSNGLPFNVESVNRARLVDLNGDGRRAVLATTLFRRGGSVTDDNRQVLTCFDSDGKELWSYEPQNVLTFGGRSYGPPWSLRDFVVSDEPGHKAVWVLATNYVWGKSFIARLDAAGNSSVQFVNSGEVAVLQRYHTPHGAMLWIGGFNDEYDTASLAIVSDTQAYAVSPQTPGTRFVCSSCGSGDPAAYFVFPRYEMSRILHNPNNKVYAITSGANSVEVHQAEISVRDQILYDFSLDDTPALVRVDYASSFWPNHLELEREGKVSHPVAECPDRLHPPPVRVYERGRWREIPVSPKLMP